MFACVRTGVMALVLTALASVASAGQPRMGFESHFNGYGERVDRVYWGGIASEMGLERGDVIVAVNNVRLNYDGAWYPAYRRAVAQGCIYLRIRDVNSGAYVNRSFDLVDEPDVKATQE